MKAGVYKHKRHPKDLYLLIGLARHHHTNEEFIIYVPLRLEKEWEGTARMSLRTVEDFKNTFEYVAERLPDEL